MRRPAIPPIIRMLRSAFIGKHTVASPQHLSQQIATRPQQSPQHPETVKLPFFQEATKRQAELKREGTEAWLLVAPDEDRHLSPHVVCWTRGFESPPVTEAGRLSV